MKDLIMFKSKIHRAVVTDADLNYEGSVTISKDLLDAANFLPYEQVHIWNVTKGTRLITYTLVGEKNSGTICINGAGAHLMKKGDIVIIAAFTTMNEINAKTHTPTVVLLNPQNKIKEIIK